MAIDQAKVEALLGRAVVDLGAVFHAALVVTGDKLGLFRALRDFGPVTSAELAARTGTHERYIREWLSAMAAFWAPLRLNKNVSLFSLRVSPRTRTATV